MPPPSAPPRLPGVVAAAIAVAISIAALAGCDLVLGGSTAPRALPSGDTVLANRLPDGTTQVWSASRRVEPRVRFLFDVYTHCGISATSFDFDGAFWDELIPPGEGQANAPGRLADPVDRGVIVLTGDRTAMWTSGGGFVIQLVRGDPGPRISPPCF